MNRSMLLRHLLCLAFWALSTTLVYGEPHKTLSDEELSELTAEYRKLQGQEGTEEKRRQIFEKIYDGDRYRTARNIKHFSEPLVSTRGTAEEIGLGRIKLSAYVAKTFLSSFAFLQTDFRNDSSPGSDTTLLDYERGVFNCELWTVGTDYPIVYHIECTAGPISARDQWKNAKLGFGARDMMEVIITKRLHELVQEYAIFILKAHGKLNAN